VSPGLQGKYVCTPGKRNTARKTAKERRATLKVVR
jgi:hypothetical protein